MPDQWALCGGVGCAGCGGIATAFALVRLGLGGGMVFGGWCVIFRSRGMAISRAMTSGSGWGVAFCGPMSGRMTSGRGVVATAFFMTAMMPMNSQECAQARAGGDIAEKAKTA